MDWYYYIAWAAIISQVLFLLLMQRNFRYVLNKYKRKRTSYRPRTTLIIPCKGLDSDFDNNITSFFNQGYDNYRLRFVVAEKNDPAYNRLCELKNKLAQSSRALDIEILIAGQAISCSQKIHNLLYCYERITDDVEILAFADSDICVRPDWLSHIVYPLRQLKIGAASGYRWFVPQKNNLATLALSIVNAKIAQLLGNTSFNHAWGGSMAIRVNVFRQLCLEKIWHRSLSDDLTLTRAVKKAGLKTAFVPACLAASYESTTWPKLFEFGRRQFLITRLTTPLSWWCALFGTSYSVLGLWSAVALAIAASITADKNLFLYTMVPCSFFAMQFSAAIVRQIMISKLLKKDLPKMKFTIVADILFFWAAAILLLVFILSSAFGRIVCWRSIRYKIISPTKTVVLPDTRR